MIDLPRTISLAEWDRRYEQLHAAGLVEPSYGGPLRRHLDDGQQRLCDLRYDNSPAALRLWNFLLSEEDRLHAARRAGKRIVGTMKDLGTVPVMAYALPELVAFYPDGAWWIPCLMKGRAGLLEVADSLGLDESFCPVRAMAGAFVTEAHFPIPDLLICSTGAVCDDLSAIAQRIEALGHPILWWEIPARRLPDDGEAQVVLPTGSVAPASQVRFVQDQLQHVSVALQELAGRELDDAALAAGIQRANQFRLTLAKLRRLCFGAPVCPLPALELLIAEMLAIHFCSDQLEALAVVDDLLHEVRRRVDAGVGVLSAEAVPVFWVNPVADLRVMNLLEDCGGRICGTDNMFGHALAPIPEDLPPLEALARTALADPMVGTSADRAWNICADIKTCGARAVVVSRIPGASHCAFEGGIIAEIVSAQLHLPVVEIEVSPVTDALRPALRTRLEALIETARAQA